MMQQMLRALYDRLLRWLRTAPPGTVPLTGVLGLAFIVMGFYSWRTNSREGARAPPGSNRSQQGSRQGTGSAAAAAASGHTTASPQRGGPSGQSATMHAQPSAAPQPTQPAVPAIPVAPGVRSGLAGVRRVTMSVPGVLLLEWHAHELSDSATVRPKLADLMKQIAAIADVYLIAHVMDDVGEAAVTGALEACNMLGNHPGGVKPHHLLFCSTLEGKVSIVRQLEPDLHVDGHGATVHELQRFMPQLLHVTDPSGSSGSSSAAAPKPNVAQYDSLHAFFGL